MDIRKLNEALDDLNNIEAVSREALLKDRASRNKEGKAYLVTGGDSFNYNRILREVLGFIQEKDLVLFETIQEMLPEIRERYRIRRNKKYTTIKQNYNDEKIATYKYRNQS